MDSAVAELCAQFQKGDILALGLEHDVHFRISHYVAEPPFEAQRVDHVCVRSDRWRHALDDRAATNLRFALAHGCSWR